MVLPDRGRQFCQSYGSTFHGHVNVSQIQECPKEKNEHLQNKIHIIGFTIKNIFLMSSFDIANAHIFLYKLRQT
jgi:hypothetical protein